MLACRGVFARWPLLVFGSFVCLLLSASSVTRVSDRRTVGIYVLRPCSVFFEATARVNP